MIRGHDRRRMAGRALQPVQPRRRRRARRPAPVPRPDHAPTTTRRTRDHARGPRHLPAVRRPRRGDHQVLRRGRRAQLGPGDRRAHLHRPARDPAALADAGSARCAGCSWSRRSSRRSRRSTRTTASASSARCSPSTSEHGVNPLASCFPFLLQIPFFIASTRCCDGERSSEDVIASGSQPELPVHPRHPREARGRRDSDPDRALHRTTVLTFLYTTATTQTTTGPQRYIFLALPLLFAPFIISQPAGPRRSTGSRPTSGASASRSWCRGSCRCRRPPTPGGKAADDQAATPTAAEEEEASMNDDAESSFPTSPPSGSRRCSRRSSTRSTSTARSWSRSATTRSSPGSRARSSGLLIGRRGQTIDAVQLLCYRVAFRGHRRAQAGLGRRRRLSRAPPRDGRAPGRPRRRAGAGERQGDRARADERDRAQDRPRPRSRTAPGLETFSEGEEPERCVIVAPLVGD